MSIEIKYGLHSLKRTVFDLSLTFMLEALAALVLFLSAGSSEEPLLSLFTFHTCILTGRTIWTARSCFMHIHTPLRSSNSQKEVLNPQKKLHRSLRPPAIVRNTVTSAGALAAEKTH